MSNEVAEALQSAAVFATELNAHLIDRKTEIQLGLLALVTRQHLFLLGDPGTAKTLLSRLVGSAVADATYFEILLTRFTDPSEVFGPVNAQKYLNDAIYERKVDGYLPWASVCMVDECWKASSAILNSLLTIVNEREFDNGGKRLQVPLETMFAASNELPEDASLAALYDRFLLRQEVLPVSTPEGQRELLQPRPPVRAKIRHLRALQDASRRVALDDGLVNRMISIRNDLWKASIPVGDRRFRQSADLVRGAAVLMGRNAALPEDLWPLAYCYWKTPDQIETVRRIVAQHSQGAAVAPQPAPPRQQYQNPPKRPQHPAPAPTSTATMTLQEIKAIIAKNGVQQNTTDVKLQQAIEALISQSAGRDKMELEAWKSAIRSQAGGVWHG